MIQVNVLYEKFPQHVTVCGRRYRIITNFREWIKFIELIEDDAIRNHEKILLMMQWYIDIPTEYEEAIYALGQFLGGNENDIFLDDKNKAEQVGQISQAFSFTEDAECIYCAFLQCYGIELDTVAYMHWWKFKILFEGLPDNTEIKQRIQYRTINLSEIKDKEERKRIRKIKKQIVLQSANKKPGDYEIGDMFL